MNSLIQEIDSNFSIFFDQLEKDVTNVITAQACNKEKFKLSYRRLVSYQAWMSEILEKVCCSESILFFKEAQNDLLTSHSLARQGAWRVALMSLRSCIENTLFGLYYLDHKVELRLWVSGRHKLGFTETMSYLTKHPDFSEFEKSNLTGIEVIKTEYATLSKAVHGSSKLFRMTKNGHIEGLNVASNSDLGSWEAREKAVLGSINLLFLTYFKDDLTGASYVNLRKAISLAIPQKKFSVIKEKYKVNLKNQT